MIDLDKIVEKLTAAGRIPTMEEVQTVTLIMMLNELAMGIGELKEIHRLLEARKSK